jgi:hypothetical protein
MPAHLHDKDRHPERSLRSEGSLFLLFSALSPSICGIQ